MTDAVIVFARAPRPGRVKTRLAGEVGSARAAEVYHILLNRAITVAEGATADKRILYAASTNDCGYFAERLTGEDWQVELQSKGDIGARMASAITATLAEVDRAILIGSDIVDGKVDDLDSAFNQLADGKDVVIGPVVDGGYWLIGCTRPIDAAFAGIDWSTERVFAQTKRRLNEIGLTYAILPVRHDIDTSDDLVFM